MRKIFTLKDRYIYPAVFHSYPDGVSVHFPDLPGCLPSADTMELAFYRAKEALQLHLYGMEEDGEEIPKPSNIRDLKLEEDEFPLMIEAWLPPFRDEMANQTKKRTIRVHTWLDRRAQEAKVDYSSLFEAALKKYLGILDTTGAQKAFGL